VRGRAKLLRLVPPGVCDHDLVARRKRSDNISSSQNRDSSPREMDHADGPGRAIPLAKDAGAGAIPTRAVARYAVGMSPRSALSTEHRSWLPPRARLLILRFNALYLTLASIVGLGLDVAGIAFSSGPVAGMVAASPGAAIGFFEAHGLALILGVVLWVVPVQRLSHLLGAAIGILLGTANLVFWQTFAEAGMLTIGYVTTTLHFGVAGLQIASAFASRE
jgi:hypothetical protein